MSERMVRVVWFVVGTIALAGVLVAFGTWRERLAVPPPAATPAPPAASGTAAAPFDPRAKPPGYDQSCAASRPWGQQVTAPFVCIDTPPAGTTAARGTPILLRGYAGGSFENNLIVEWQVTRVDGSMGAPALLPQTYRAPDIGTPGPWFFSIQLGEPGVARVRLTAYFESPKDGARMAEASVEVEVR